MTLEYIVWNANPEIFHIGNFALRWYGLLFALSFVAGYYLLSKVFKKENISIDMLDKLTLYMGLGVVIGARLGHCLFYQPNYYLSNPIEILKIWEGGLASHGAAIGILFALYLFSRKTKFSFLWIVDRIVIVVALSGFFIRLGNLMNSEIYGVQTSVPWAFVFVRDDLIPRHPTQIYEALSYLILFFFLLHYYYKQNGKPREGMLFSMFLIILFSVRFFIEFFKEAQVDFEQGLSLNMGQLLSIPFIIIGIALWIWVNYKHKKIS